MIEEPASDTYASSRRLDILVGGVFVFIVIMLMVFSPEGLLGFVLLIGIFVGVAAYVGWRGYGIAGIVAAFIVIGSSLLCAAFLPKNLSALVVAGVSGIVMWRLDKYRLDKG